MTKQAVPMPLPADQVEPPAGLPPDALYAWRAAVESLGMRTLDRADLLTLEAGVRAWARWRALEEKIAQLAQGNPLAGEVSKGPGGELKRSALREAADDALDTWRGIARGLGLSMPDGRELPDIDLFGYPDRPGRGQRGRPRFRPTLRDRNRVRLLLALGWSNERIAAAVEVSLPTLRRYFKAELKEREVMRDRFDARRFELAMEQANRGNMAALREVNRMVDRNDRALLEARLRSGQEEESKQEDVGKKEAARRAAVRLIETGAAGDWGDDAKPGLPN